MPAASIVHALERGVSAAHVSKYDAACSALNAGQRYTTTLASGDTWEAIVDEGRNYMAERGFRAGFGYDPQSGLLTIFGG